MADKYLYNNAGVITERELTVTSAGAGNAGDGVALDGTGHLDATVMPTGIAADTNTVETTEDIADGSFVNVYASTGAKCRKADATTAGKVATGYVKATTTSGQNAVVYPLSTTNDHRTGLTAGEIYFLNTTAGGVTVTAPSSSGNVVQRIGVATSTTAIATEVQPAIVLA